MTATVTEKAATTTTAKRPSRASRAAAQNGKPARKPATKPASKPASRKDTGPSEREQRQTVAALLVELGAELVRTWKPGEHGGISKEIALDAIRQSLGYVPATAWDYDTPHKILGARTVGRPRPATKSA
jgi:hypothetical protein